MFKIQEIPEGILINIIVQPRSAHSCFAGTYGDALKLKLTAPPVDGAANRLCIKLFSKALKRAKSTIEIKSGHSSRKKKILIHCPIKNERRKIKAKIKALVI